MKKLLYVPFVVFIFLCQLSYSQYVSQDEAQVVAQTVFNEIFDYKAVEISKDVIAFGDKKEPTLFAFNSSNNGFVIVSAEKRAYPILAYSTSSTIDDEKHWSPSFKAWLEMYSNQITEIREENIKANFLVLEKWDQLQKGQTLGVRGAKDVAPLLVTTWNQGCGYNALCPVASGGPCGRAYTGCVATAMAQVMRYMEYPSSGTGSQCYNTTNYGELCADFENAVYNYSIMPNNSGNAEVAKLMYHCGVSVYMNYSPSGSGAYSHSVARAWRNFFDYKNHILIQKNSYAESDWIRIIRNEIDNSRPIYYAGFSSSSGHAFVFDGYQGTDHFHVNWGWGGAYDGYFYVSNLKPGGSNYSNNQQAIVGAIPRVNFTNLDVSSAVTLTCASPISGDISTGVDYINYYKNTYPAAVGKELVYTFTTYLPGRIRVKVTNNVGGNVNTFLLSHPHQDSLVAYGTNGFVLDNTQPTTYYLVVEGDKGKEPTFDLEVICPTIDADLILTSTNVSPEFLESLLPNVMFTSTVKNIGNTDAGSCSIKYYLSNDDVLDGSDILLGSDVVPALAVNQTENIASSLTMPSGLISGDYYVIFVVDEENVVVESDDDNFGYSFVKVPDPGLLDCSFAVSLVDGEWYFGNTETDGVSNVEQYWSSWDMTGPEVVHSFVPLFDGFARVSYVEKNPGNLLAIILPICNENTYLRNIWFASVTDTIGFVDLYVNAGTEYFIVVDGQFGVSGEYALKVDLPKECPEIEIYLSGSTRLCDGQPFPSMWAEWGASSYQWYKDGEAIPGQTDAWFSSTSVGDYHLEMTENGCTSSSDIISIQMSFPPDTAQIISSGDLEFCQGGSVELSLANTVLNPFNWAINGELIEGATGDNYTASEPGVYSLVTQNGSCSVASENSITVTTKQLPTDVGEELPLPSTNLSFYYTFDKDNADLSGNNNNFSCWNFEPTNDRFNNFWQARYFTDGEVFGYTQYSSTIPDEFTLSLWFKTSTDLGGLMAGFANNPWNSTPQMESVLYMSNDGKLHYYISNSGTPAELVSTNAYNDDQWHLVTIQYNGHMKMTVNNVEEILQSAVAVTKQSYTGYWVFAGRYLPLNVSSMPTSAYFNGSLDEIILLAESNDLLDYFNFALPRLELNVLSETDNCLNADFELHIENSELDTDYRLWNETTSEWFSDPVSGNYSIIALSGYDYVSQTTEIRVFASNALTSCERFLDTSIVVNVFEATSITVQPEGQTLCEGDDYTFSMVAVGENLSYQWKKGEVNVGSNSPSFTILNAGLEDAGEYYCVVSGFCGEDSSVAVVLSVFENPTALAGVYDDVCGNSIQLSATDPSPFTGEWTIVEGIATIENSTAYNSLITDAVYGNVTLRWTVSNGTCSSFEDVIIRFLEEPVANAGTYADVCGSSIQLNATDPSPFTGEWTLIVGNATIENSTQFNSNLTNADYGDVVLSWVVTNEACQSTDQVTITFIPQPTANYSFFVNEFEVNFNNLSLNALSYLWDFGDGVGTSDDENPDYQYTEAGSYTVTLTSHNGVCSDIYFDVIEIQLTGEELISDRPIALYPNPFNTFVTIRNFEEVDRIVIKNLIGQRVMELHPIVKETISTNDLIPGIYLVAVYSKRGDYKVLRMVKQ